MTTIIPGVNDDWVIYGGQPFNETIEVLEGADESSATAVDWTDFTGEIRIGADRVSAAILEVAITHGDVSGIITVALTEANVATLGTNISVDTIFEYDVWMTSVGSVNQKVLTGILFYKPEVPDS